MLVRACRHRTKRRDRTERRHDALVRQHGDADIVHHTEPAEHALDLQRARDAAAHDLVRLEPENIAAIEGRASAVGAQLAGYQIEQRRLAGAVRPDDGIELAACEIDRDVVDRNEAAEALGHAGQERALFRSPASALLGDRLCLGASRRLGPTAEIASWSRSFQAPAMPRGANMTTRMVMAPTASR